VPGQHASARNKKAASAARHSPLTWKLLLRHAVVVAVGGLVIYLLLPKLTQVLASWPRLAGLAPAWMVLALAAEVASFTCYFGLQRVVRSGDGRADRKRRERHPARRIRRRRDPPVRDAFRRWTGPR
jgi:hypothetical protein